MSDAPTDDLIGTQTPVRRIVEPDEAIAALERALTEGLQDWWEHDMTAGLCLCPAPGGLLPWGESNQGDMFLWSTTGDGPGEWLVTVASHNGGWWHYAGGAVQFLAELCDGTLEPWELPPVSPDVIAL